MAEDPLDEIEDLPTDERLVAYAELAATTTDPAIALRAKVGEIMEARHLGRQQHAVVGGTELLGLIDRFPPGVALPERVTWGLKYAIGAALDIPEIPLVTVDQLIGVLEQVLQAQQKHPYAAWQLRARRAFVAGDDAEVEALVHRLVPHVSRSNHFSHDLDCPGCSLAQFAQYLGPDAEPAVLEVVLEPILSGRLTYRNEDPQLIRVLSLLYGERESCANGLQATHAWYARALIRAGRLTEARHHVQKAREYREGELGTWSDVAALELALAEGDLDALRAATEDILDQVAKHEDINEAVELASLASTALRRLGDPRADELHAQALSFAARLDARLDQPRHVATLG